MLSFTGCFDNSIREAENKLSEAGKALLDGEAGLEDVEQALGEYQDSIEGKVAGFDDINAYIEQVTQTEQFQQTLATVEEQGLKLELAADGNNLVYRYTYNTEVAENVAETLEQSLAQGDSTLGTVADAIRIEAPCVEKVVFEYYTMDGELLASVAK